MAAHYQGHDCDDAVTMSEDVRLIPVVFVHGDDEAMDYCSILEDLNIRAQVGEVADGAETGRAGRSRTAVLVPAPLHERATEIIAAHDASNSIDDDEDDDDEDDAFDDDEDDEDDDEEEDEDEEDEEEDDDLDDDDDVDD